MAGKKRKKLATKKKRGTVDFQGKGWWGQTLWKGWQDWKKDEKGYEKRDPPKTSSRSGVSTKEEPSIGRELGQVSINFRATLKGGKEGKTASPGG